MTYAIRDEYMPRFGRQRLTLWSGNFASDYVGTAWELPNHAGFMIELEHVPVKIRVVCESPRTAENFEVVDDAIAAEISRKLAAEVKHA